MKRLAIIGGGSWGTALAVVLEPRFAEVRLWVYEAELAAQMRVSRENDIYLPGIRIPERVQVVDELWRAAAGADIVLGVTPSQATRRIWSEMHQFVGPQMLFASATKGLEQGTLLRMSQVIRSVVGDSAQVAALSGPTFALEVARGEPTALVVSSEDAELNRMLQSAFSGPTFRVYTNSDPVGVELAAALKNVIAIAAGVCQGLGLGSNTRAALIARGLAEITRLTVALGGRSETLAGLAGLGDLVLTCTGELSRNRQVGIQLGQGRSLTNITSSMRMVAEGVQTTGAAMDLAAKTGIEMPITAQVSAILCGERSPREAIRELMERTLKGE